MSHVASPWFPRTLYRCSALIAQVYEGDLALRVYTEDTECSGGVFVGGKGPSGEGLEFRPFDLNLRCNDIANKSHPSVSGFTAVFKNLVPSPPFFPPMIDRCVSRRRSLGLSRDSISSTQNSLAALFALVYCFELSLHSGGYQHPISIPTI